MNHLNEEQLILYYYGEETAGVEDHLGECESCREGYHALQRVLNSVDSLPIPERPADYEAQVWRAVERCLPRKRSFSARWLTWKPLVAAASMAALLAGLPLALGTGFGSELRRPLGIAMVGGLLLSQALTLYTTPVIYIFFDSLGERFARKSSKPETGGAELAGPA